MNPNSAYIWFPPIQAAGLPVPRTEIVRYNPQDLFPMLDGQKYGDGFPLDEMHAACERIGFPVFVRSDLSSAKHANKRAWLVEDKDSLLAAVYETFEDNELKWLASETSAFMLREYLPLKHSFIAFGGLPISRERRYFVEQDGAKCSHPYWPEDAFEHQFNLPENWKESLRLVTAHGQSIGLRT